MFALHNSTFDVWTLFWFGLLGFFMRQFGFPLAPLILGVVLGNVAELNLSRAFAISTDLSPFVTRPWSLFFLTIALFSAGFPYFQSARVRGAAWTRFYLPAVLIAVTLPFVMMGGTVRPVIGAVCFLTGCYLLFRRFNTGDTVGDLTP
jgi:putative tricarboxylic transport membrane protein